MRSYVRLMPDLYRRKALGIGTRHPIYPPDAIVAFVGAVCLAEAQPERGVFESERLLRVLLEGPNGVGKRYARQVPYLVEHGDLVRKPDGSLYLDGWTELQEGEAESARERARRYRERQRDVTRDAGRDVTRDAGRDVTCDAGRDVTSPSQSEPRARAEEAVGGKPESVSVGRAHRDVTPKAPEDDAPESEIVTWLAKHGAYIRQGSGWHVRLVGLVERRGAGEALRGLNAIARANPGERFSDRQWLMALEDLLEVKPDTKAIRSDEAKERASGDFERRVMKTRRYIESLRGEHDEPKTGLTKLPSWTPPSTAA